MLISLLINLEELVLSKFKKCAYNEEFELRMNIIEKKLTDEVFHKNYIAIASRVCLPSEGSLLFVLVNYCIDFEFSVTKFRLQIFIE